jgi:hypothetical protein
MICRADFAEGPDFAPHPPLERLTSYRELARELLGA